MKPFQRKLLSIFLIDLPLVGLGLLLFSYFHHVMPVVYHPISASEPAYWEEKVEDWSEKFPDKFFSDDTVEKGYNSYKSKNINLTLTTVQEEELCYYVADVYVRNILCLKTAFAGGEYTRGVSDTVEHMAEENEAVFAISGDYNGLRDRGIVIRNGIVYRTSSCWDVCALYYDGTMETYSNLSFNTDRALREGVYQTWDFGPALLDAEGKALTDFENSYSKGIANANPRCAIGYYEPGHYVFVAVDGRRPGHSNGMTLEELAKLFESLGCKRAYNLDGGNSACMVYNGRVRNWPSGGGREISDILYLTDRPTPAQSTKGEEE